jgi:hypothetical protein
MTIWYVIASDVTGCISSWSGPWSWSLARTAARRHERDEMVSETHIRRWSPVLKPWLKSTTVR